MARNRLPAKAWGPYASQQDAVVEPMPQAVRSLHQSGRIKPGDPDRLVHGTVEQHVLNACADSHVELGDYDWRILAWLSNWESGTAQAIVGLIRRAYASGIAVDETGIPR